MPPKKMISINRAAAKLAGGKPMATHQRPDGTLAVIDPAGKKRIFTPKEVQQARKAEGQTESEGAK